MANKEFLGSFSISQDFTNQFALLSGDKNPLHVDPVAARRYQFGSTVTHGICCLLSAIELLMSKLSNPTTIGTVKVQFNKPVRHDDVIEVYQSMNGNTCRLELFNQGKRSQRITLLLNSQDIHLVNTPKTERNGDLDIAPGEIEPNNYSFEEAATASGDIELNFNKNLAEELFPTTVEKLPFNQIAALLASTVIVGMECPGINSVYGGLSLSFNTTEAHIPETLLFKVIASDERFNRLVIAINNSTCDGEIEAFYRAPPVSQPTYKTISSLLSGNEFKDQRALIIGGSRGLGEITSKLLSAGGAKTAITYNSGIGDAQRVAEDINKNGGHCLVENYNVLAVNDTVIRCFGEDNITHIYYLASPLIEKNDQSIWNSSLFSTYCNFYTKGLADLLSLCNKEPAYKKVSLDIFIPSTIFISEPQKGFAEYCAAKSAAETMASALSSSNPNWRFRVPRLPRMQTDQTSGAMSADPMDAVHIMHKALIS